MKIRPDQFEAMRGPDWEVRRRLYQVFEAVGYRPRFDRVSGDLLFDYDRGGATRVRFDDKGFVRVIEEPGGRETKVRSDDAGRPVVLVNPRGGETRLEYDERNRVVGMRSPDGFAQRIAFRSDVPVRVQRSDGASLGLDWTPDGAVAVVRDALGKSASIAYDASGRLVEIVERGGARQRYVRDDAGELREFHSAGGRVWKYERDELGVEVTTLPDGSRERRFNGGPGGVFARQDSRGALATVDLDGDGAPLRATYPGGPTVRMTWAGVGCPASVDNGQHIARFEYDAAGRRTCDDVDGTAVRMAYDDGGAPISMTWPSGDAVRFEPGPDGRVERIVAWQGHRIELQWSPGGLLRGVAFNPRIRETFEVGGVGRVLSQTLHGAQAVTRRYSHDPNGNVTRVDDSSRGRKVHVFDADDRLVGVEINGQEIRYAWDPDGNMVQANGRAIVYDALNRCAGGTGIVCRHDEAGNLAEWNDGSGTARYRYNSQRQLVEFRAADGRLTTYEYDGLGRRIVKTTGTATTRYAWYGELLVAESTTGSTRSSTDYLYVPGTARPLAMRRDGRVYFFQCDHLDTPIRLLDANGEIVWEGEPFGTGIRVIAATVQQPLRFPGQYFDSESGLYYNVARYYQPALGRFTSPDPPFFGGEANGYRYALNNPVSYCDPSGRNPVFAALGLIAEGAEIGAVVGGTLAGVRKIADNVVDNGWAYEHWLDGVGNAVVDGAIIGAAAGASAVAGAMGGFALGGPPGAIAAGIVAGFTGAAAASGGLAAYRANPGHGWEACLDGMVRSIPFVATIQDFNKNDKDPNRWAHLGVGLAFDVLTVLMVGEGARSGYSKAVAADSAGKTGMGAFDGMRQQGFAKDNNLVIIDRASNASSRQYDGKPGYRPKPHDVETLKTAQEGENAGLVVKPKNPTEAQAAEIARLESQGWSFDEQGRLVDPNGNRIHGDYDLQGVYRVKTDEHGNKTYEKVDTNDPAFRRQYNDEVTPGNDMVQHGANDNYYVRDANGNLVRDGAGNPVMGRQPGPGEVFKVTNEKGETVVLENTAAAQRYYEAHGIPWPYQSYK